METLSVNETHTSRVDVLIQQASIDWENPSRTEVAVTGAFISRQGGQIHHGLGGSSQLNVDKRKYEAFRPYLQLEEALKFYIPNVLGIQGKKDETWDDLSEKIGQIEKQYGSIKKGLWHSLWYKMGKNQETADAWIAFIPDEYGLGVVKAGIALVFKLAESSVEKRKMIFDTFAALRDSLIQAHPERRSFRTNQKVNECVDQLYQTVVDSIQDLAVLLTSGKSTWGRFTSKFKRRTDAPLPSTEEILRTLELRTKEFHDALQVARDRTLESTEMMTRATGVRTVMIHEAIKETAKYNQMAVNQNAQEVGYIKTGIDRNTKEVAYIRTGVDKYTTAVEKAGGELNNRMVHLSVDVSQMNQKMDDEATARVEERIERGQQNQDLRDLIITQFGELKKLSERENRIARREMGLQEQQQGSRTLLMNLLLDRKRMEARIEQLEGQVQHAPKAVVSLDRFCEILARPVSDSDYVDDEPPDLERMLQHPTKDLGQALAEQCSFTLTSQGQVQSLLGHKQFLQWLNRRHPDLILVDANIEEAALDSLSVISVFCATFVTSMMEVQPDDLVAHFFCGLHSSLSDPWYGPNGLVRSLIMQLLMKLVAMDRDMTSWNLDFINHRDYLWELERHDLPSLCVTLHSLLYQFPADMTIFCIVDSISCFNVDRLFGDFRTVMECLQGIVDDGSLAPIFKVLLTNPAQSTLRIKELPVFRDVPSRLVSLSEHHCHPGEISAREVESSLLRSYSPLSRTCSPLSLRSHSPLQPRPRSPLPPPSRSPLSPRSLAPLPPYGRRGPTRVAAPKVDYVDEDGYYYEEDW